MSENFQEASKKNSERNEEKKCCTLECLERVAKVTFYFSIIFGSLWAIIYFGFKVQIMPEIDSSTILYYLIAIFGIEQLIILLFVI